MDGKMTLEQVRDWHIEEVRRLNNSQHPFPNDSTVLQALAEHHQAMADAIDAHLTQPARVVDVGAIREVIADLKSFPASDRSVRLSNALTRAIGNTYDNE